MRFQVVSDPRARSAACHGLTRAAARGRTATVSALAAAACGLVMTACGSQNSPGAASSCSVVRRYDNVAGFAVTCQHRRLCHLSAENQHHRHRRSGGPGRRLPQVHQRQPDPVPHERLACRDRADGHGKGHASAAHAIDHVRRLALHCPATRGNTPARRFRLRGCRGRRPASRRQHSLPRTIRPPPGEPAGRFGKCDHLGVAARRKFLPAGLHISRRLADGWDVDDNNAFQPCTLGTGRRAHITWDPPVRLSSPWAVIVRLDVAGTHRCFEVPVRSAG